ncbi:unnamed protein product [Musa acuminata var. zebrina]
MEPAEGEQTSSLEEDLLLPENVNNGPYTGDGSVDMQGNPIPKDGTGNWKACPFILANECCERLAYYGISTNLVTYLKKKFHEANVSAARKVTTWQGTCYMTPLIGAILADAYWGRYRTIAVFSTIYFIGLATLTLSATVPAFKPPPCVGSVCPKASAVQYAILFIGLYSIALGTGGIKPCVSSFGADQFDDTDEDERRRKQSFFDWFYLSISIGALISSSFLVWVQDTCGWGWGFGIPTVFLGLAICSFTLGTSLYRFQKPGGNPLSRMCQVIVASFRKRKVDVPDDSSLLHEVRGDAPAIEGNRQLKHTDDLKFLDKAATTTDLDGENGNSINPWRLCTVTQVEELKILTRMFPVWATTIVFSAVFAQMSTLFVVQGMVMDMSIGSFVIPPASMSTFDVISVIVWVLLYDNIVVPVARRFTGEERGFSDLQRMGIGLFISILAMVAAALVEIKRLDIAHAEGLVHEKVAIPLSIMWQAPQYSLIGAAEVFTYVGSLAFFYDQAPNTMRSLCSALSLLTTALGSYLSSLIVTAVTSLTTWGGNAGWIPDNLNEGHLDYYFWLLAGLSCLNLLMYAACAKRGKISTMATRYPICWGCLDHLAKSPHPRHGDSLPSTARLCRCGCRNYLGRLGSFVRHAPPLPTLRIPSSPSRSALLLPAAQQTPWPPSASTAASGIPLPSTGLRHDACCRAGPGGLGSVRRGGQPCRVYQERNPRSRDGLRPRYPVRALCLWPSRSSGPQREAAFATLDFTARDADRGPEARGHCRRCF